MLYMLIRSFFAKIVSLDSGTTHTHFAFSHNHCQLVLFTEIAIETCIEISTETPNKKEK